VLVSTGSLLGLVDSLRRKFEATTSANVGGFAVPMGTAPLRATFPSTVAPKRRKKRVPAPLGTVTDYQDLVRVAEREESRLRSR
jgi:hypothetical protein